MWVQGTKKKKKKPLLEKGLESCWCLPNRTDCFSKRESAVKQFVFAHIRGQMCVTVPEWNAQDGFRLQTIYTGALYVTNIGYVQLIFAVLLEHGIYKCYLNKMFDKWKSWTVRRLHNKKRKEFGASTCCDLWREHRIYGGLPEWFWAKLYIFLKSLERIFLPGARAKAKLPLTEVNSAAPACTLCTKQEVALSQTKKETWRRLGDWRRFVQLHRY